MPSLYYDWLSSNTAPIYLYWQAGALLLFLTLTYRFLSSRPKTAPTVSHTLSVQTTPQSDKEETTSTNPAIDSRVKQPYDVFLVLDVEATCKQGSNFEWPNEIIEWPVCVMKWKDKSPSGKARELSVIDEFRSFVQPTWRPQLSQFCTDLTGITQDQIKDAPTFPRVLKHFSKFLAEHGLIDPKNGRPVARFCWCSDGPFDIRDFVVKQCFISKIPMPIWLKGDVMDVRRVVSIVAQPHEGSFKRNTRHSASVNYFPFNISQQLRVLGLPAFQGHLHSGIDDSRNLARIIAELARRDVRLEPNTHINPRKRWPWMGKPGQVLEAHLD